MTTTLELDTDQAVWLLEVLGEIGDRAVAREADPAAPRGIRRRALRDQWMSQIVRLSLLEMIAGPGAASVPIPADAACDVGGGS